MKDRNENYVPDGLHDWRHVAEIDRQGRTAPIALGLPDELNRDHGEWWWADVSGDGTHWSQYNGHRVQVDVTLNTQNYRDVNDWKGRDEIRGETYWHLKLNRQPIWEGHAGTSFGWLWHEIPRVINALIEHPVIDWNKGVPVQEQLLGRKVYYRDTPAVVSSTVLSQGCVMLSPVGVDFFPTPAKYLDREDDLMDPDDKEVKTDLLDRDVWWWRHKEFNGDQVS